MEVSPLYLIYRTERLNNFFKKQAARRPRFWKIAANIGLALAVGEMILAFYLLGINLFNFLYAPQKAGAVFPILPGITVSPRWFPYLSIAIGLAILTHELAHGVVASLEGIRVKSSGIFVAPITFGGFVEQDEEAFNEAGVVSRLRLVAAGSLANLAAGLLVTLLATSLFVPNSGVLVMAVGENSPAHEAGVGSWEVIYEINGTRIENLADLATFINRVKPGNLLLVKTSNGVRGIRTEASPVNSSRAFMGVYNLTNYVAMGVGEFSPQFTYHLNLMLYWVSLIMTNLAIINMLPLFPLDGETYLYSILKERVKKNIKEARIAVNAVSLSLFVLNVALTFLRFGLTPI